MKKTVSLALTTLLVAFGVLFGGVAANADTTISPVMDKAGMLTQAQETNLKNAMVDDYNKYHVTYVLETIPNLQGQSIETYALDRANELGVGDSKTDNGIFIVLSRDDHKIRFQLGSGVQKFVTDNQVTSILNDKAVPQFKEGNYAGGLINSMDAVGSTYASTENPTTSTGTNDDSNGAVNFAGAMKVVLAIVALIAAVLLIVFLIFRGVKGVRAYNANQARKLADRRTTIADDVARDVLSDMKADNAFMEAKTSANRRELVMPRFAEYLNTDPDYADSIYEVFFDRYVELKTSTIKMNHQVKNVVMNPAEVIEADYSLTRQFESFTKKCEQQHVRDQKMREEYAKQQARQRELDRVRAEKRRELEEKQKAEAKAVWEKLTEAEKKAVRTARTKKDKIRVLDQHSSGDLNGNMMFPILFALYASEVGRPQSESSSYGYSSRSDDSPSTPSYTTPSFDTTSFGGGGFDGGGGTANW